MSTIHQKISIPAGTALVGTRRAVTAADSESPARRQKINGFLLDNTAVSNARFEQFISDTGYLTEAERLGWS